MTHHTLAPTAGAPVTSSPSVEDVAGRSPGVRQSPGHRRGGALLRRLGSVAVVLALTTLGLGAGLWLGTPASAAVPPLLVSMDGGATFTSTPGTSLLDVSSLAPGGHVTGTMTVRDDSDSTVGTGSSDTITLGIVDGWTASAACPVGAPVGCASAGTALKDALDFVLTVKRGGTVLVNGLHYSADNLISGVVLATGVVAAADLDVTLTASLPNGSPAHDNLLQYGSFAFSLGLALDTRADSTNNGGQNNNPGGGGAGSISAGGDTDTSTDTQIDVEGTSAVEPGKVGGDTAAGRSPDNILVLGDSKDTLGYTGAPIRMLLIVGGSVLAAGIVLLVAGGRRRRSA